MKRSGISYLINKVTEITIPNFRRANSGIALTVTRMIVLCLLSASWTFAATFSGKCVAIGDGDTISVMKDGRAVKIRIEGIDCPELGQDFGMAARRFTSTLVFGKVVSVKEYTRDQYERIVARVYIDGQDLSLEIIKAGLAWYYRFSRSDPVLSAAEKTARKQKIGLWSMPDPIPPWVYRRQKRIGNRRETRLRPS
jgi:micrococcal nuclease